MKFKFFWIYHGIIILCAEAIEKNWDGFAQVWHTLHTDRDISGKDLLNREGIVKISSQINSHIGFSLYNFLYMHYPT